MKKFIILIIFLIFLSINFSKSKNTKDINFLIFNTKSSNLFQTHNEAQGFYVPIILFRLGLLILKLFNFPIAFIWLLFNNYYYNTTFSEKLIVLLENPLSYPLFSYSLQTAIPWYKSDRSLNEDVNDKEYWFNVFNKLNVPQPKLYGIIQNKKIVKQFYPLKGKMIFKPTNSGWGRGIRHFNKEEINNITEKTLIQERIINEFNGYFRLLVSQKELIQVYYYSSPNKKNISVNPVNDKQSIKAILNFETFEIIHPESNKVIKHLEDKYRNILNLAINDAIKVTKYLKYPEAMTYDVITQNHNYYFLEGNLPGATYTSKFKDYFNLIKNIKKT